MGFGLNPVSVDEIPEAKEFGAEPTLRSMWCEDILDEFLASDATAAFVEEDYDGKPFTDKTLSSFRSSFGAKASRKKYKNIQVCQRGRRIYLSKVRIYQKQSGEKNARK